MAIPHILSSGFRFKERTGVTDVQTIMDDVESELLTADNGRGWYAWTKVTTGTYQAPVWDGHTFRIELWKASQQKLQLKVWDQNYVLLCTRRLQAPSANAWTVRIFSGPAHFVIDVMGFSAQPEGVWAGALDLHPDAQSAHPVYVYGGGTRNGTDSADGYGDFDDAFMLDDATPRGLSRIAPYIAQNSGTACGSKTLSGAKVYRARNFYAQCYGSGGTYGFLHYAGKAHQQLFCPIALTKGSRVQIPIDQGVLGEFIVCGCFNPSASWGVCVRSA